MSCPPPLREYLSFLPRVGYAQPNHPCEVQVRLRVASGRELLLCAALRDMVEKNVLEVPMSIAVADQTLPVQWLLRARLTSATVTAALAPTSALSLQAATPKAVSALSASINSLAFGPVLLGQSAVIPITLTNHSVLLQKLVAHRLPACCTLPGEQGLLNLMPLRSLTINVAFTPISSTVSNWTLVLRSKLGQEMRISCTGCGVHSPVSFDRTLIKMRALVPGDVERAVVMITNPSNARKLLKFIPPCDPVAASPEEALRTRSHLTIEPATLSLEPGGSRQIAIIYAPRLTEEFNAQPNASAATGVKTEDNAVTSSVPESNVKEGKKPIAGKSKKMDAAEQARLEAEAHAIEEQRQLELAKAAQLEEEREMKRQAELLYNSKGARRARERALPSNPLLKDSFINDHFEDVDADCRDPQELTVFARHRINCLIVEETKPAMNSGLRSPRAVAASNGLPATLESTLPSNSLVTSAVAPDVTSLKISPSSSTELASPRQAQAALKSGVSFFLQVNTCLIASPLLVDYLLPEAQCLNFSSLPIAYKSIKKLVVKNVSDYTQYLRISSSNADALESPFAFCSSLSTIAPGQSIPLSFSFCSSLIGEFQRVFHIQCASQPSHYQQQSSKLVSVPINLHAIAVQPTLQLSHQRLTFASLHVNSSITRCIKVTNTNLFALDLRTKLAMHPASDGTLSGLPPFLIRQSQWNLPAGASMELPIVFQPDHHSLTFYCQLTINQMIVELHGICHATPSFLVIPATAITTCPSQSYFSTASRSPLDELEDAPQYDSRLSQFDAAFSCTDNAEGADIKAVPISKAAKGKSDSKAAAAAASMSNNIAHKQLRLMLPGEKVGFYDDACASGDNRPVRITLKQDSAGAFAQQIHVDLASTGLADERAASATYETIIGSLDAVDTFFSITPSTGALKTGDSHDVIVAFDLQRFNEWRSSSAGGVQWSKYGCQRTELSCLIRSRVRYTSGEKGAQPIVTTSFMLVTVALP